MDMRADNVIEVPGALILGAGIAGLFTALKLSPYPSLVLAATRPGVSGSSAWAQGGIAAAMDPRDSWQAHAADTISAGAGTCEPAIVDIVAREAQERIRDLIALGAPFDRNSDGSLALGREAAHSANRIVHVRGDSAGAEVTRTLADRALATDSVSILEGFHAIELAIEDDRVAGLFARHGSGSAARLILFRSSAVIFATGGIGALYAVTTNPPESRGEGLGMAARAGALIADPEFVQFHPTAIAIGHDPAPLATEALRGVGAILVDETGYRFMPAVHQEAELAPRDVVARAIHRQIGAGHRVFLDCRDAIGLSFAGRFPTVYSKCIEAGIDPVTQPIPVAPAAHYHMGGIATDENGRGSIAGLWAVGECASTGLHGANRLASNSLLEAIVFGARTATDVRNTLLPRSPRGVPPKPQLYSPSPPPQLLRDSMARHAGLERDEAGLRRALAAIRAVERASGGDAAVLNMTAVCKLVAAGALQRQESRGAHFRSDYPKPNPAGQRTFMRLADTDRLVNQADSSFSAGLHGVRV